MKLIRARMEEMISEYGKQIKAFLHFMFKHLFEFEFGIRAIVEILMLVVIIYILIKFCLKIIRKVRAHISFIKWELVVPLCVRLLEKLAFLTNNPNWQERANKIKDAFKKKGAECKKNDKEKSYAGWWIFIYLVLVAWIIGFHYYGEEKRSSYEVFFLGEKAILTIEEWITNTLFDTDEDTVECFFHDKIEVD